MRDAILCWRLRQQRNRTRPRPGAGLTLVECVLSMLVLSLAVIAALPPMLTGHHHLTYGDKYSRAVHVAEHLLEETVGRSYEADGSDRSTWGIDDYDGFAEDIGELRDFTGSLYDQSDQLFTRSVSVRSVTHTIPELDGMSFTGKAIDVTVQDADGHRWVLTRFVPEPFSP